MIGEISLEWRKRIRVTAIVFFAVFSGLIMGNNLITGIVSVYGDDFKLRRNEAMCVRVGIDPYDIVTKTVVSDKYALWGTPEMMRPGMNPIHVYPPWEYTWFLPFTFLEAKTGGAVFLLLSVLAYTGVGVFSYLAGVQLRGDRWDGVFCASATLFLGWAAGEVLYFENFGALNAFYILLLILMLKTDRQVLAGFVWGLLMTKPQIGLLFAIPLLIKRRFVTIAVAAAFCLLSTIPASVLCHRNPVEMLLEVPKANSFLLTENGTMLIPQKVFQALSDKIPRDILDLISMSIGIGMCLVLSWRLRNCKSWFLFLGPTVLCALMWTYCKPHDRVILWLTQFVLSVCVICSRNRKVRIGCLILILLSAWPYIPKVGMVEKALRRVSLFSLLAFFWFLPKNDCLHCFEKEKN